MATEGFNCVHLEAVIAYYYYYWKFACAYGYGGHVIHRWTMASDHANGFAGGLSPSSLLCIQSQRIYIQQAS